MNTLIITGGAIEEAFAGDYLRKNKFGYIVAADKGLVFCREMGIRPDLIVGDFDSADRGALEYYRERFPERILRFRPEKDETDTEIALTKALENTEGSITILGATGTRLDHVLGNIQLLKKAADAGRECFLTDSHNRIRLIWKYCSIRKKEQFGSYVSLIPFTPKVKGVTLKGFKYPLTDYTLLSGRAIGVSNEITGETGEISFSEGLLLVIESRDE